MFKAPGLLLVFRKITLRGHLKSSHIADKRKNFHMALYPLPPSSNESVIDNERNVWQMTLRCRIQDYVSNRPATHKGVHKTLVIVRRCPIKYPSSLQPAPTWTCFNVASLAHAHMQGRFPGGSESIVKWARRQSRTVEEYDFYPFFCFCMPKSGRVV